jgi:hypothetical protein
MRLMALLSFIVLLLTPKIALFSEARAIDVGDLDCAIRVNFLNYKAAAQLAYIIPCTEKR